jgi:hypothetical protein
MQLSGIDGLCQEEATLPALGLVEEEDLDLRRATDAGWFSGMRLKLACSRYPQYEQTGGSSI